MRGPHTASMSFPCQAGIQSIDAHLRPIHAKRTSLSPVLAHSPIRTAPSEIRSLLSFWSEVSRAAKNLNLRLSVSIRCPNPESQMGRLSFDMCQRLFP